MQPLPRTERHLGSGFIAGAVGAGALAAVMAVARAMGLLATPPYVEMYSRILGSVAPSVDSLIAFVLFIISGGIWGAVLAMIAPRLTIAKAALFGLAPTFFLWLVVAPVMRRPLFNGFTATSIIAPLLFNCLVWGVVTGATYLLLRSRTEQPATSARPSVA